MTKISTWLKAGAVGAAVALSLSACGGSSGSKDDKFRIGVAVYGQNNFITQGKEGMEAYAAANNIELLWNSAEGDVGKQATQVEQLANAGVNAIIIVPVQFDALEPQIRAAKEKNIPVFAVNTTVQASDLLTASVLPDDVAAGQQVAQMVADHLGGKGKVAILQCVLGSSYEIDRTKGMEEVFSKYPGIEIVAKGEAANNGRTEGAERVRNWLTGVHQIDAIASCGDDPGLGALQAVKEAGKKIPIVGIDGVEDGLRAVESGDFLGTQMQHGRVELAAGLAVANKFLKGEKIKDQYVYKMLPVDKKNVDQFLKHVVTEKDAFIKKLPELVDRNVETGDLANEGM